MSSKVERSRDSYYYVTDDFYRALVANLSGWEQPEKEILDPAIRDSIRRLLEREARYLDQRRFADWLNLYTTECVYWVPTTVAAGDPRREVAITFDDRRRLEDRVFRIQTGYAWSQIPPSRTVHSISNVEAFATDQDTTCMVRSTFVISEFRAGETRILSGWCAHRLRRRDDNWEILIKQVNLIDSDQNLRNLSIIL